MVDRAARVVELPAYRVTIQPGALDQLGDIVQRAAPGHRPAIITDANVEPLYAERARTSVGASAGVFRIPAGEAYKTRSSWSALTDALLAAGHGRDTVIVALGGGVIGDLAGFVAATFMRGVPFVQVPTSLLAMIDASVGGKTGVDTEAGKNLVGAFHQPVAVVADPAVLATLPAEHLRAGMAEAIKHGVVADAAYFDETVRVASALATIDRAGDALLGVVARSVEIKAGVVRQDEREGGLRKTLNFGHTIGHAVELCSDYTILHGAAVAIGMVYESRLAERIGVAEAGTADRVRDAVQRAGLPTERPAAMRVEQILTAARGDKKARGGRAEYALPARIGAMAGADRGWSIAVDEAAVAEILR